MVAQFSKMSQTKNLKKIQAAYSIRDLSHQFGLSESSIRRWTKKGVIPAIPEPPEEDAGYDFHTLTRLRRIRKLRNRGLTMQQIESELHGQMNLFPKKENGHLIPLPIRRSPLEEALLLHEQGDMRAKEMYRLAILQGESVSDAYCNLGILEFEDHDTIKAFDHFTNALKFDPRHFESHFNLAHLYFEAGDYNLAELHYEISATLEPNAASAYFNLGLVYAMKGETEAAIDALNRAMENANEQERGQVEELLENLKKALKEDPSIEDSQEELSGKQD